MSIKAFTAKYEACLRPFIVITTFVAGLALIAMMLVTVYDVILRLAFHRSLAGAFEISEFTLAIMAPLALIYCEQQRHHISVDLIVQNFPKKVQLWFEIVTTILAALIYIIVAWQCWLNIFLNRIDQLTSPVLLWPVWIFTIPSAIGFFFLFLLLLDHLLKLIGQLRKGV